MIDFSKLKEEPVIGVIRTNEVSDRSTWKENLDFQKDILKKVKKRPKAELREIEPGFKVGTASFPQAAMFCEECEDVQTHVLKMLQRKKMCLKCKTITKFPIMKPSIGRIVRYLGKDGIERAAIIVKVWSETMVNLQVFGQNEEEGIKVKTSVPMGSGANEWQWPVY